MLVSVIAVYFSYSSSHSLKKSNSNEVVSGESYSSTVEPEKVYSEATFPNYSLKELKDKALFIVKGVPVQVTDEYMVEGDIPFTEYEFKVDKVYKGDKAIQSTAIKVLQDGNELNEFIDHPLMELNKEYLLFLKKSSDGHLIMVGGPNGKFTYNSKSNKYESLNGITFDDPSQLP